MPIFSYLAMPIEGAKEALAEELKALSFCEVLLVLVTDAPDEKAQQDLLEQLQKIPSLQSLSMTFGCSDELQPER